MDCRMSRPVQAVIVVPVETALGLSNEPAWLDGYGWLDAPSSRLLLLDAALRRMCIDARPDRSWTSPSALSGRRRTRPACGRCCWTCSGRS